MINRLELWDERRSGTLTLMHAPDLCDPLRKLILFENTSIARKIGDTFIRDQKPNVCGVTWRMGLAAAGCGMAIFA